MKRHVLIGASILSSIEFPYAVIPIVSHHHENWDGTGYPDGLRGDAIPLGARILMVVDCFDALTSDRPYRSRMSHTAAFEILLSRKGTMYDPRIVDTFIDVQPRIAIPIGESPTTTFATTTFASATRATDYTLSPQPARLQALADAFPGWLCVFYEQREESDVLIARYAKGPGADIVQGHSVACGTRVSGWVAATGQAMESCDGRLDLGNLAEAIGSPPGAIECTSASMILAGMTGVLTLYRTGRDEQGKGASITPGDLSRIITAGLLEASSVGGPATLQ